MDYDSLEMSSSGKENSISVTLNSPSRTLEGSRDEYFNLLSAQVSPFFPKFCANIAAQTDYEREKGRAAVIEYGDGYLKTKAFESSTQLQDYLDAATTAFANNKTVSPRRRVFLLEDLPRNHIEILGSHLLIPPSFFAAHWDDPTEPNFNHRSPFCRFSSQQFLVKYPTSHRIELDPNRPFQRVYATDSNVRRYLHMYDPRGPLYDEPKSYHNFSFWGSEVQQDGSWDAVVLLDPPVGRFVRDVTTGELIPLRFQLSHEKALPAMFLNPDINYIHTLPKDRLRWRDQYQQPSYSSMFDDILEMDLSCDDITNEPISCTILPRRLLLSIWLSFLRRRSINLLRLQNTVMSVSEPLVRCDYMRNLSGGRLSSWHDELFSFIVNTKFRMTVLTKEVQDNTVALGIHASQLATLRGTTNRTVVHQWELDGWQSVLDSCISISHMADTFSQSYMQYVTIQEAHLSNINASSLSRITILTMLFIPLSTVAGIFSMSGDYMPGNSKGWIFWVVSVPVLLLLAGLYWRKYIQGYLLKRTKPLLPTMEKKLG
jgi:hypothetical protein